MANCIKAHISTASESLGQQHGVKNVAHGGRPAFAHPPRDHDLAAPGKPEPDGCHRDVKHPYEPDRRKFNLAPMVQQHGVAEGNDVLRG